MASIRKRGKSYQIRCSVGIDSQGKEISKSMTWTPPAGMSEAKARKEAEFQAALFEDKIKRGIEPPSTTTLIKYLDDWLTDHYKGDNLRRKTYESYKSYLPRIDQQIGYIHLDKLSVTHIDNFYNYLRDEPITTIQYKYKLDTNIKNLLNTSGFTYEQASQHFGISTNVFRSIREGKAISHENASKLSDGLKLPLSDMFQIEKKEYNLSAKTIKNYHVFLTSALTAAVKKGLIPINPAKNASTPKVVSEKASYLDEKECTILLQELNKVHIQYRTMLLTALYLGVRRGELLGLKWENIDFHAHKISIHQANLYFPHDGVCEEGLKTSSSERTLKASKNLIEILSEYKKWQDEEKNKLGDLWQDEGWVFTNAIGKPFHPDSLTSWVGDFSKQIGIKFSLKSLRHTNASLLIASNTDPETVANRLGHAATTTTLNVYSHLIKSRDAVAADSLDDMLKNK